MQDQTSIQKRVLIATLLAFVFFIGYDYFYLSKIRAANENNITSQQSQQLAREQLDDQIKQSATNASPLPNTQPNIPQLAPQLVAINSEVFHGSIDEFGRISSFVLDERVYKNEAGSMPDMVDPSFYPMPLEIRFTDAKLNQEASTTPYTASVSSIDVSLDSQNIILTQKLSELEVVKNITFHPNGSYDVKVTLSKDVPFLITPGFRPNIVVDGYTIHGAIIKKSDEKFEVIKDGKVKNGERFDGASIAAASDRYYTNFFYQTSNPLNIIVFGDRDKNVQVFAMANGSFSAGGFLGPKHVKLLKSIDPELTDVVEYGWFTFLAKPMFSFLDWIYSFTGNWGWSIVLLTIFMRILLFPFTFRGMVSMNKMKDLAPKMKELQEKYKDNREKLQLKTMELYKSQGANPMSGCLPLLLQIPIFFAIYRVLLNSIELKGAPWIFWINDLAVKDPFFVLPAIMGLMMFLQQKITPTNFTDPMQEKVIKFMPLIFCVFMAFFPAGLTLYWCINNSCSFIQQLVINRHFAKQKAQKEEEKMEKSKK